MGDENSWVLEVGRKSGYLTNDPDEACLFVVSGQLKTFIQHRDVIFLVIVLRSKKIKCPRFNFLIFQRMRLFS